jgi:hypothetical protein
MTMANAPLAGRDGCTVELIWVSEKQKYFCKRGWTTGGDLPIGETNSGLRHHLRPSWPGLSRPSTAFAARAAKTWMPGIRLRQGFAGFSTSPPKL